MKLSKQTAVWVVIVIVEVLVSFALAAAFTMGTQVGEQKYEAEAVPYLFSDPETGTEAADRPLLSLPAGSYRITIDYDTASETVCETWYQTSYGPDYGDRILLVQEAHTKSFELITVHRVSDLYLTSSNPDLDIRAVTVQQTGKMQRVLTVLFLFLSAAADVFLLVRRKQLWERLSFGQKNAVWGVILIGLITSVPLFTNYLLDGADLSFHLMRIEGLAAGLREGSFPVKMQPLWINDYRYPVSVLYGDLLLYPVAFLRMIGFPLQTVYKLYMFLMNLLTAATAYGCGKKISGSRAAGLVGSLLYTFAGYRIMNLYLLGAAGAVTSLALLPIVFLGLWMMLGKAEPQEQPGGMRPEWLLLIGYTGLLQSHLLGFEMAILLSVLYCLLHFKTFVKKLPRLIGTAVVTILLNLGFLVPMFDYMLHQDLHVFHSAPENLQQSGLFLPQVFQMFAFHTGSDAGGSLSPVFLGIGDEYQMGVGAAVFAVWILYIWIRTMFGKRIRELYPKETGSSDRIAVLMAVCMLMTCYFFPWSALAAIPLAGRLFSVFQFAMRFTMMALVFGLMLTAYVLKYLRHALSDIMWKAVMICLCVAAFIADGYNMEMTIAQGNPLKVTSAAGLDTRTAVISGEYILEGTYGVLLNNPEPEAEEGVIVSDYQKRDGVILFSAENTLIKEGYIKVPFLAYMGYHAVDVQTGQELYFGSGDQNVIMVIVPSGYSGTVKVYFKEPKMWRRAELVSLMSLIGVVTAVWIRRRKGGNVI